MNASHTEGPSAGEYRVVVALATMLAAVGIRQAVCSATALFLHFNHRIYFDLMFWEGPVTWVLVAAVAGGLGGALAAWVHRLRNDTTLPEASARAVRQGLALGALGCVLLGGLNLYRHGNYFTYSFDEPGRVRGLFPFEGGSERIDERYGFVGTGQIHPDGYRRCAPEGEENADAPTVVMVGDSFVYGLAVDDPDTLCWKLRETRAQRGDAPIHFINLGQPGASLYSYTPNFRYAVDTLGADAVIVGLLLPNDSEVVDRNTSAELVHKPWFWVVSAALTPEIVHSLTLLHVKTFRPEYFDWVSIEHGLDQLLDAIDEAGVPAFVFMWDTPDPGGLSHANSLEVYEQRVNEAIAEHPGIVSFGVIKEPRDGTFLRIPKDFHPTPEGHSFYLETLDEPLGDWLQQVAEATP